MKKAYAVQGALKYNMKSGIVKIDDRVRSRPLGQKRGKGQPKRLPRAWDKSP